MNRRFVTPVRLAVALSLAVVMLPLADLGGAVAGTGSSNATRQASHLQAASTSSRQLAAREVNAPVPDPQWSRCFAGNPLQCARVAVPLDYDHPNGATIKLDLTRRPVAAGRTKLGTLFINPGGPGAPAGPAVMPISNLLGGSIHQKFDVVGIEPRGVGGKPVAHCQIPDRAPSFFPRAFPMTPDEVRTLLRFNRYERAACRRGGNVIIDHMTTADTARDMDLMRQAVGDPRLTFYGVSYGTYLGATYARLFPGRVRAIITDGVLDPVAWSTGHQNTGSRIPFSTRLRSGHGAADALLSALAVCNRAGKARCAFAGNAGDKWRTMTSRLRTGPVRLSDGNHLHYADLVDGTLGALYSRSSYRPLMHDLQQIWAHFPTRRQQTRAKTFGLTSADDAALIEARDHLASQVRDLPFATPLLGSTSSGRSYGPSFFPSFEGVACADTRNPRDPQAWVRAANRSEVSGQPWFGRDWTWASGVCPSWPGSSADAFRGPWRTNTSTPVLVVGNTHDPATPISGARALHRVFGNSRLVTMNGWGHGAIGESRCVTRAFSAYLVNQTLPDRGTVCRQDRPIFPRR